MFISIILTLAILKLWARFMHHLVHHFINIIAIKTSAESSLSYRPLMVQGEQYYRFGINMTLHIISIWLVIIDGSTYSVFNFWEPFPAIRREEKCEKYYLRQIFGEKISLKTYFWWQWKTVSNSVYLYSRVLFTQNVKKKIISKIGVCHLFCLFLLT